MTGLVTDPAALLHDTGPGHPECPRRMTAILDRLEADGLLEACVALASRPITDAELFRVHTPDYLRIVAEDVADGLVVLSDLEADGLTSAIDSAIGVTSIATRAGH